ncbi:acetyl-CoA carboxylase, biotin carboxylase subunit [Anaerovibrio lipolyticus DSM 3074]|uniref:biotin carboxylase n=3 Tax=Anaerovibrio TaxID=82373 RepID=A0A0B2JZV8_9FIRM|nr:acetyl-CoA carboxylase biotin carboxylase subunit [Anaerovibrio lipolyticus]KHM53084.1 acetyl-CoA carboxylase [Anaerovibrio lipolyticus]SHI87583.1 acetyl-CoA carboxylase, biotin carboxylase subunit [Anaerovibrio lipolyticus DSM 3074]
MFKRVLIANRGEIAVRIIRACQELDIETIAVYSDADADALHVRLADKAVNIGPADAQESYLNKEAILNAAIQTKADALHPGYGFLSEDADFAEQVTDAGITWIGPMPETIRLVGDKDIARASIMPSGIPMAKGSNPLNSNEEAIRSAKEVGYPVILKPVSGGGGKGMCVARDEEDLKNILKLLVDITKEKYYFEHFIERSRHIEVQVVADNYGEVLHLGERECSLQRRNQKLLEESPSIALTQDMRNRVGALAVKAAKSVHYSNIGTVEFLLDLADNEFYFMEINPRIQVEHGITEVVTGIDLVRTQICIAAGESLDFTQDDVTFTGHAIECRINAEDPDKNFMPSPGHITFLHEPSGPRVRFDSGVTAGLDIEPYYDSLIAKIIVHGRNRGDAIKIMERALHEFHIEGVKTTLPLHNKILRDNYFRTGNIDTQFIKKRMPAYVSAPKKMKGMSDTELARAIIESMYLA